MAADLSSPSPRRFAATLSPMGRGTSMRRCDAFLATIVTRKPVPKQLAKLQDTLFLEHSGG
jgi:hypothetical protein